MSYRKGKGKVNCQELVFVFLLTFSSPPINSSLLTASHEINGVRKEKERLDQRLLLENLQQSPINSQTTNQFLGVNLLSCHFSFMHSSKERLCMRFSRHFHQPVVTRMKKWKRKSFLTVGKIWLVIGKEKERLTARN